MILSFELPYNFKYYESCDPQLYAYTSDDTNACRFVQEYLSYNEVVINIRLMQILMQKFVVAIDVLVPFVFGPPLYRDKDNFDNTKFLFHQSKWTSAAPFIVNKLLVWKQHIFTPTFRSVHDLWQYP